MLRRFVLLFFVVMAAVVRPCLASAATSVRPETRVKGFDLVAGLFVGLESSRSPEIPRAKLRANCTFASGYLLAAEEGLESSAGAAESAFSVAAGGGRNSGFLRQTSGMTDAQLERSASSFQAQIEAHEAKLADPAAHAADWSGRSVQAKEGLMRHWSKEIQNFSEQQSIVQELLFRRGW